MQKGSSRWPADKGRQPGGCKKVAGSPRNDDHGRKVKGVLDAGVVTWRGNARGILRAGRLCADGF